MKTTVTKNMDAYPGHHSKSEKKHFSYLTRGIFSFPSQIGRNHIHALLQPYAGSNALSQTAATEHNDATGRFLSLLSSIHRCMQASPPKSGFLIPPPTSQLQTLHISMQGLTSPSDS